MCRSVDTMEADNFIYFSRLATAPGGCEVSYSGTLVGIVSVQFVPASSYSDVRGKQLSN